VVFLERIKMYGFYSANAEWDGVDLEGNFFPA
jgi:hypothetical protein